MSRYVYFLRPAGQDGPVKIGCSTAPQSRHLSGPTMTKLLLAYGWEFGAVVIAAVVGESYEDSITRELEGIAHERREIEEREQRLRGAYARLHARRAVDRGGLRLVHPEGLQPDRLDSRQG